MNHRLSINLVVTLLSLLLAIPLSVAGEFEWSSEDYARIVGDFNGDGEEDYLYQSRMPFESGFQHLSRVSVNESGEKKVDWDLLPFTSVYQGLRFDSEQRLLVAGDFNGDGLDDLLALNRETGNASSGEAGYLFINDKRGVFHSSAQILKSAHFQFLKQASLFDYQVGDVNGDGRQDLMVVPAYIDSDNDGELDRFPHDIFYLMLVSDAGELKQIHQSINPHNQAWASDFKQVLLVDLFFQWQSASSSHHLI